MTLATHISNPQFLQTTPLEQATHLTDYKIPGVMIPESSRQMLLHYIKSSSNSKVTMRFRGTKLGVKPAPVVASFSSRGPNSVSNYVLKPDLIAPGANILVALPHDAGFGIISGTSISCPHVSGVAALLKGAHPDWSPAMIKSALMTTAYTIDNEGRALLDTKGYNKSTPWAMGAGHIDPMKASNLGLVYDLSADNYLDFLCASCYTQQEIKIIARRAMICNATNPNPWDLNYSVIMVYYDLSSSRGSKFEVLVRRTITHVSDSASTYTVKIFSPNHASVVVDQLWMKMIPCDNYGRSDMVFAICPS